MKQFHARTIPAKNIISRGLKFPRKGFYASFFKNPSNGLILKKPKILPVSNSYNLKETARQPQYSIGYFRMPLITEFESTSMPGHILDPD